MIPVDVKRAAFRQLYANANAAATQTLQQALAAAAAPSLAAALAGKQVIEAQAEGVVTKYQLPNAATGTQSSELATMWGQLQDLYDSALLPTTNNPPGGGCAVESAPLPSAAGAAIYTWMMGKLNVYRAFTEDFSQPNTRI